VNDYGVLPLTFLPVAGIYIRSAISEKSIWLGCSDDIGRTFGLEEDPVSEEEFYTDNMYYIVKEFFPCFRDLRPVNKWAGYYAVNSFDGTPVVAPISGMIYLGCTSGSGILKCDALGRIVAAVHSGYEEAELFGGRNFRVNDLGIDHRRVEKESFIF
jgi:glycine/D-amino acid oxidase-like deaminating enzyme